MELKDKIQIEVDGTETQVFMSYGLILKLTSIFEKGIEDVASAAQNPDYHMALISIALSGKDEKEPVKEHNLTLEEGNRLLDWIFRHVTNFFAQAMTRTLDISQEVHNTIQEATEAGQEMIKKAKL